MNADIDNGGLSSHSGLEDAPLETALDALLSDYLDRLDILFRAYSHDRHAGPSTEAQALKLHDEALERRHLVGLFENEMNVGSSARIKIGNDTHHSTERDLVSLPAILDFDDMEMENWKRWRPEIDETVLVYLSVERGYWPGKIIDLGYFSTLALPRIPRHRMYSVRIYPTKQHPIITIKSHIVPLHLRPRPPRNAPSTLTKAYRTAESPLLYDIEALGLEVRNQPGWGADPTRLEMNGGTWYEWKDWIEDQARVEGSIGQTGRSAGSIESDAIVLLNDLEGRGYPVFTSLPVSSARPPLSARPSFVDPQAPRANFTKGDFKRSRKRLMEALQDPIIGPALNKLSLGDVCRALIPPPDPTKDPFSGLAPDNNNGISVEDEQIRSEALDHVLGKKRKRGGVGNDVDDDVPMGFVARSTERSDDNDDEGWSVVKRNRHR